MDQAILKNFLKSQNMVYLFNHLHRIASVEILEVENMLNANLKKIAGAVDSFT